MGRLLASLALALVLVAGTAVADPIAVSPTGDAEADLVAVSGTGGSRGLVAVSGLGDAYGAVALSAAGDAWAGTSEWPAFCVDALCANGVAASGLGDAYGIVALSAAGHATGGKECLFEIVCFVGVLAVGGAGADEALVTLSVLGDSGTGASLVAVSVLGTAGNAAREDPTLLGASVMGDAFGTAVAASGAGNAWSAGEFALGVFGSCNGEVCNAIATNEDARAYWLAASATGDAYGRVAASLLGDAFSECDFFYCAAASGFGDASGITAVSVAGDSRSICPSSSVCPSVSGIGDSTGGSTPLSACRAATDFTGQETCLDPQTALELGFA